MRGIKGNKLLWDIHKLKIMEFKKIWTELSHLNLLKVWNMYWGQENEMIKTLIQNVKSLTNLFILKYLKWEVKFLTIRSNYILKRIGSQIISSFEIIWGSIHFKILLFSQRLTTYLLLVHEISHTHTHTHTHTHIYTLGKGKNPLFSLQL